MSGGNGHATAAAAELHAALRASHVRALREQLWDAGFRPVAVYSPESDHECAGKAPRGDRWAERARQDPPEAATRLPDPDALNTGLLADGLRPIDVDIDNPTLAHSIKALAVKMLGEAPIRYREDSPRVLLLYRAAIGEPPKRSIAGRLGKVEVLGRGQQFVAFGRHPSGAELHWMPDAPGDVSRDALPAVNEEAIQGFLEAAANILGAKPPGAAAGDASASRHGPSAADLRVAAALHAIPNEGPTDWEHWNRVGMATWAATGGSDWGRAAFHAWSERHSSYDPAATDERWRHYPTSPPSAIGAGTLFHLARQAAEPPPAAEDVWGARAPEPDHPPNQEGRPSLLRVLTPDQCEAEEPAPYVIKGLISRGDHAVLMGQPGAGKSVLAPHFAYAVAQGQEVFGRRVKKGAVIYVAAEDGRGTIRRVRALRRRRGDAPDFHLVPVAVDLLEPGSRQLAELLALIRQLKPSLVVLDTVGKCFPGLRENEAEDMGRLVRLVRQLTAVCDSAVLSVHHVAKDAGTTPRGHGSLNGDADVTLLIEGIRGEVRTVKLGKNRSGPSDAEFAFMVGVEELGTDEDGDPITAPIAEETEELACDRLRQRERKLQPKPADMLRHIREAVLQHGEEAVPKPGMPPQTCVRRSTALRLLLIAQSWFSEGQLCPALDGDPKRPKLTRAAYTAENNALTTLKIRGFIGFDRDWVWLL